MRDDSLVLQWEVAQGPLGAQGRDFRSGAQWTSTRISSWSELEMVELEQGEASLDPRLGQLPPSPGSEAGDESRPTGWLSEDQLQILPSCGLAN